MPKPVYMLCSKSGSVDKESGLTSHFLVIERIVLNKRALPSAESGSVVVVPAEILSFQVVAIWEREEKDTDDTKFDVEIAFTRPEKKSEDIIYTGDFKFTAWRHRFTVEVKFVPLPEAISGTFKTECRVRRHGSKSWSRQTYNFLQEISDPTKPESRNGKARRRRRK